MPFHDECGVMAVSGHPDAANLVYLGLYALQHRGQESAGIASWDGGELRVHRGMGYVADIFEQPQIDYLRGALALGHVRYSTSGTSSLRNAQPMVAVTSKGHVALAHNGNLINAGALRESLEAEGAIFTSHSDSEIFLHLLARSRQERIEDALVEVLGTVHGAYSLVVSVEGRLFAARDPHGFRPLVLGRLGEAWVVASETCALDLVEADVVREVAPGEILEFEGEEPWQLRAPSSHTPARCSFEHIYFARPDSQVFGESVAEVRERLGRQLAREYPVEADVVIPVPDSGMFAALGYSREADIPYAMGLVRNHYVGRTFIEPRQSIRHFGVKVKLNPVRGVVAGKRIVLVDDSLVRGTTSRKIVAMLRKAGAEEIHLRISSPPTRNPCYYGIDTPERKELIANRHNLDEIRRYVGADSLGYLSLEGLREAVSGQGDGHCFACFDGAYPVLEHGGVSAIAKEER